MPKISVLIPLYNQKKYASDCINSVLNQTFKDFEIIIRDDFSTDGVYEFVQEKYAKQISDNKIKLFRNKKNLGEAANIDLLLKNADNKYFTILHNDDLYLPNALQHFYEVAEHFNADVVHSSNFLISGNDGIINGNKSLRKTSFDKHSVTNIEVLRDDPLFRFNEWFEGGTFRDLQYNIFRRKFISDKKIFSNITDLDPLTVSLIWIMKAKILVKTPEIVYIRRENPDSQKSAKANIEKEISKRIEFFRRLNSFISDFEFFKNNAVLKYKIKSRVFANYENLNFDTSPSYGNENFVDLYNSIENIFRKYFGEDAVYLALLYHWGHFMHFNQSKLHVTLQDCLKLLERNI